MRSSLAGTPILYLIAVLLLDGCAASGPLPGTGGGTLFRRADEIDLNLHIARFRDGEPLLHVHISFPRSQLLFLRDESGGSSKWRAEFEWRIVIRDRNALQVGGGIYSREVALEAGERPDDRAARIRAFESLTIPPGRYRIEVTVEDRNSVRRGVRRQLVEAFEARFGEPGLSEIELLDPAGVVPGITADPDASSARHRAEVLASSRNPEEAEQIAFLFETYRLPRESRIVYRLLDSGGNAVRSRERPAPAGRRVVVRDTLSSSGLREGTYELQVEVEDVGARGLERKRTLIVQRSLLEWGEDPVRTLSQLRLYASPETVEAFSTVAAGERRAFLEKVWKEMDPTPETASNEFREEFERRLRFAEERWAAGGRRGWEVDIGRIYVAYGEPDEVRGGRSVRPARGPLEEATDTRVQIWIYRDPPASYTFIYEPDRGWVLSRDTPSPVPPGEPAGAGGGND